MATRNPKAASGLSSTSLSGSQKRLIENTTEHQIDLHYADKELGPQCVSIPRASFDQKGVKINGRVVVETKTLDYFAEKEVVHSYFTSGDLIDKGEADEEVEPLSEDQE
jgi:hypothetical protein